MSTFIAIAWRNVWRNKRRSFLTMSMIAFGLLLSIFMESLISGTQEQIFKGAIEANVGSFQIHAKDYQENQTLSEIFTITPEIEKHLKEEPLVQAWTSRIMGGGMVSVGENTNVAAIIGIDPIQEAKVSVLEEKMMSVQTLAEKYPHLYPTAPTENRYLSPEPKMEIIVGDKLASKLEARIGDELAAMVQGADGSMGSNLYTIIGIYHTGFETDHGIYMHIQDADDLFSMYGQVSVISAILPTSKIIPQVVENFRSQMNLKTYEIMGWYDIAPELVQVMDLKNASNHLFMAVLMLIIAFGILNTVFMTIMERIKEYGVLKALGTTPLQIFSLVFYETLFVSLIGILLGNLTGGGLSYYFKIHPIDVSMLSETYEEMGFTLSSLPTNPQLYMFIVFSLLVFGLSMIAAVYPAIKAARLEPLDALKHT